MSIVDNLEAIVGLLLSVIIASKRLLKLLKIYFHG
jgi:hypothetical protein